MPDTDDQRDHDEERYWANFCPECGDSPCGCGPVERLVQYAASERHEEATEELVAAAVEVDGAWRHFTRGITTANEFVNAAAPHLNKLHEVLAEMEEQGFGSAD